MGIALARDGRLSPNQSQTLYWVRFGSWAIGRGRTGDWEIFKARPSNSTECGYMFTFQYSIPTLEDTSTFIHRIRPSAASEEKGPIDVLSIYLPRFKENFENGGKVIQINTKYKESNIAEVFKKSAKTL